MVFLNLGSSCEQSLDLLDGVQNGGVILAAEGAADFGEGGVGELAGEVHGDLARERDGLGAVLGAHVGELDAEEVGRLALDCSMVMIFSSSPQRSARTSWASSMLISRPLREQKAIMRVSEPSISRMLALMRLAIR